MLSFPVLFPKREKGTVTNEKGREKEKNGGEDQKHYIPSLGTSLLARPWQRPRSTDFATVVAVVFFFFL